MSRSFDLGIAVQEAIRFVGRKIGPIFTRNIALLVAFCLIVTIVSTWMRSVTINMSIDAAFGRNPGSGAVLMLIILWVALFLTRLVVIGVLVTRFWNLATDAAPQPWAWFFGEPNQPLIGLRADELSVGKAYTTRVLLLWPLVVAALLFGFANFINAMTELAPTSRAGATRAAIFSWLFWLIGVVMLCWALATVVKRFLYAAPVASETGRAEWAATSAVVPGHFPQLIITPVFWKHVAVIVFAWLPVLIINYLFDQILYAAGGADGLQSGNLALVFIAEAVSFLALVISTALLAGALTHMYPAMRGAGPAAEAPAEPA